MQRSRCVLCLAFVVVLSLLTPAVGASPEADGERTVSPASADYMKFISINGCEFDPLEGVPELPEGLGFGASEANGLAYYVVQFDGPIMRSMKDDLSATGATILSYVSYNAFVVRADKDVAAEAEDLPRVRWIGLFEPAYKLSPLLAEELDSEIEDYMRTSTGGADALARAAANDRFDEMLSRITETDHESMLPEPTRRTLSVEISIFEDWNMPLVLDAVADLGGTEISYSHQSSGVIRAEMDRGRLAELAHEVGVMWIDRHVQNFVYNDIARWVIQSGDGDNYATPIHDHGIWGTGQIVTVGDTGIDYEHDAFEDPSVSEPGDTHRKVTDYYVPMGASGDDSDQDINHGTHTSGTVAGDDGIWHVYDGDYSGSNGTYGPHDGQAFDATLQVQDLSPDGYGVYPPNDTRDMYQEALDRGSWIHTNSWGSGGASYCMEAAATDDFIWDNEDFLVVFAAGNSGAYYGALNCWGAAKNIITVGATENGYLREDVAYFSSRGPVDDGRLKPDVMAPGVDTWSALGGDPYGETDEYVQYSGTSMATPTVAGSCALIRQYYMDGWYPTGSSQPGNAFTPSAALIKATVINSAAEMTGSGAYDMGETWYPNNNQGWGRVTLDESLFFEGDSRGLLTFDERTGLSTGETAVYQMAIADTLIPVEVTLVWTDYPGAAYSNPNLVNDLDLIVTAPDGTYYIGNQYEGYDPGESVRNPSEHDHLNNVESVLVITDLQAGIWTVEVSAENTPVGPQPYALVMTGGIATEKGTISMDSNHYQSDATITIRVADTGLDLNPNAQDTAPVLLSSTTEDDPETIILTETGDSTTIFQAMVALDLKMMPVPGDGALQVQNLDTINASYYDDDDGLGGAGWVSDFALIDDDPPAISSVTFTDLRPRSCKVTWTTDELSNSSVWYGTGTPPGQVISSAYMTTSHVTPLTHLTENVTYYFAVGSTDDAGNTAFDDNGSAYYTFTTPPLPPMGPVSEEWPTYQNNIARVGLSPSDIEPPLELIWSEYCPSYTIYATPIISEGVLVTAGSDGWLRAWDPYTGEGLWELQTGTYESVFGTPTAHDGVIYSCGYDAGTGGRVLATDIHTGELLWSADSVTPGIEVAESGCLAYHDGAVIGSGYSSTFALDAEDGSLLWENYDGGSQMGVAVANGLVYLTTDYYGSVLAADAYTGETVWTQSVSGWPVGAPCASGLAVYVVTDDGGVYAFDAFTGEGLWSTAVTYPYLGTPVYDGAALYVGGYDTLYAFDAFDGTVLWEVSVYDYATNAMSYANGYLYCSSVYGGLQVRDVADGSMVYSHVSVDFLLSAPIISENWVWVQDYSGTIYCFRGLAPAGLQVTPSIQTVESTPDNIVRFEITVENIGYLGEDTFDAEAMAGVNAWETVLLAADGETPLEDTDGDYIVDTGPLGSYENTTVVVLMTVPSDAVGGDTDTTMLSFTSSTDTNKSKNASVTALVPMPGTSIGPMAYSAVDPGESMTATMDVVNEGGLPDTIDIEAESANGWEVSIFAADGSTRLLDTDGDDVPDVGELAGLDSAVIVIELAVPEDAQTGSFDRTTVTARSSADPEASDDARLVAELLAAPSADWPTFGHDAARTGMSPVDYELPFTHRWSQGSWDNPPIFYSSPVISDGTVYYADADGYLRALDLGSGEEVWVTGLGDGDGSFGSPTVADGVVYITMPTYDYGVEILAVDQDTGSVRWSYEADTYSGYGQWSTPAVALGYVYWVDSSYGTIYANDAQTGELMWTYEGGYGPARTGPTYWGGMVFHGSYDGGTTALDAITGDVLWTNPSIWPRSAPVVAEGVLYISDSSGCVWAIDPFDGTTVWSYEHGGYGTYVSPLAVNGLVLEWDFDDYNYEGRMLALDAHTGDLVWEGDLVDGYVYSSPAYNNGTAFTMTAGGYVIGWDVLTGERVVNYSTGVYSYSSIALGSGHLIVAEESGFIHAYGFEGAGVAVSASVSPDPLVLDVGQAGNLEVSATDMYGAPVPNAEFEWESLSGLGSVYPITATGEVVAYVAGNVAGTDILQFTSVGIIGTATVEILPGSAGGLAIDPVAVTLVAGETAQFSAAVTDEFGNERDDVGVTWSASASAGTIDSDGTLSASTVAGTGTVTAQFGEFSASAAVTIVPGALADVRVDPAVVALTVGSHAVIEATALDEFGNAIPGLTMSWSYSQGTVLPTDDDNAMVVFVAPTEPGSVEVTVSVGGFEATVQVEVEAGDLDRIVLTPNHISVQAGESLELLASWEDLYGNDLEEDEMDWDCTIGTLTVGSDGLSAEFHAGGFTGDGEVTASFGDITASASVTVADAAVISLGESLVLVAAIVAVAILVAAYLLLKKGRKGPAEPEQRPPTT